MEYEAIFLLLFVGGAILFAIFTLVFWVWMLIDCLTNEPDEGNDKIVWALIIVFLGWLGALIYYFARRPSRPDRLARKNKYDPRDDWD